LSGRAITESPKSIELITWAYFYANPLAEIALEVLSASLDGTCKHRFFAEHQERQNMLQSATLRIREQRPLITSKDLLIARCSGKTMVFSFAKRNGLRSTNNEDKKHVLDLLKKHPLWPNR